MNLPQKKETSVPLSWTLGPNGEKLYRHDLPKPGGRFYPMKKGKIACAVSGEIITFDEALKMYGLTKEELENWLEQYKSHGLNGLKLRKLQSVQGRLVGPFKDRPSQKVRFTRIVQQYVHGDLTKEDVLRMLSGDVGRFEFYLKKCESYNSLKKITEQTC